MRRSFTNRILGGVCGGLAASLRLNVWILRALFVVLTFLSMGTVGLLYIVLWWIIPPESPSQPSRIGFSPLAFFAVLLAFILTGIALFARGSFITSDGQELFLAGTLAVVGALFFLRQLRG
jgi:phage shock protein PspC (stress-responsive transcriptional regulator)